MRRLALCCWGLIAYGACASDVQVGAELRQANVRDGGVGAGGSDVPDATSTPDADAAGETCQKAQCLDSHYACGDCKDNDSDGLVDMADPDCVGPCHNAEDSFYGPIPGQTRSCVQECYFDADSGWGNDRCEWFRTCDEEFTAPAFPAEGEVCPPPPGAEVCEALKSSQSEQCLDYCGPLTPNGCDCFGCCNVPGADTAVWLGSTDENGKGTCSLATIGDPTQCHPCTIVPSCFNPCDECELCVGKNTLPETCEGSAGPPQGGAECRIPECVRGTPCGVDCLGPCPAGQSCLTGCCISPPE